MKKRLDIALVEQGLQPSREKARGVIMSGLVYVNGQKADKAGEQISDSDSIEVRGTGLQYVSRGGLKLEKSIQVFHLDLSGCVCCDFGASTGGFTDCMLQNGASKVYAIDVGYGQLAWSLRSDERVVNMERCNIRYLEKEAIPDEIDFISIDVSFISLSLVLPVAHMLLKYGCKVVCLVKPQFEAGRDKVGKKGVVRDPDVHREVLENTIKTALSLGFHVRAVDYSPVKGPQGNIEYLLLLEKTTPEAAEDHLPENAAATVVALSHSELSEKESR